MTFTHYVGLDLGQSRDYTAVSILEEALWLTAEEAFDLVVPVSADGWLWPQDLQPAQLARARSLGLERGWPEEAPLAVRHLQRFELGTSYPKIVERVAALLASPVLPVASTALVVDMTGVGRPVVDLLRYAGLQPIPVTITAGASVTQDPEDGFRVPKRDLVSMMAVLLEQRRLRIAEALPEAATLTSELQTFKRTITPAGHDSYAAWREQQHDDLVLATALACWFRGWSATQWQKSVSVVLDGPVVERLATFTGIGGGALHDW